MEREMCGDELLMNCQMSRVCDRSVQNVTPSYPAEVRPGRRLGDNIKMGKEIRHDGLALDSSDSWQDPLAGFCEHGNESSGFLQGRKFLDQLGDH
jgi:hypothetical protein